MSDRSVWQGRLEDGADPPRARAEEEPPESTEGRHAGWIGDHDPPTRDMTPAVGKRGGPAEWQAADPDAPVSLARESFGDARWSYLFRRAETSYAAVTPEPGQIAAANIRMRSAEVPDVHGPFIKPPVWTWEVPVYFWIGGIASGTAFVAAACDIAGDRRSAAIARKLALGTVSLAPPLLVADLGRPGRFLNMLRIIKPRSPMNLGAWCLVAFSATAAGGVGADVLGRPRVARWLGAATALLGGYLGSYTGVLLAATAVPLWARSRSVLGPVFVCTATASGAAATRLTLVAAGMPAPHPTRRALGWVETAAIAAELGLSQYNHHRLGQIGAVLRRGRPGQLFRAAEAGVMIGVTSRVWGRRHRHAAHHAASLLYILGALAFRFAWIEGGKASALDHEAVAAMARGRTDWAAAEAGVEVPPGPRRSSQWRRPVAAGPLPRAWSEAVRRASLAAEPLVQRVLPSDR